MELEDQVTSLELSKRLKELGVKQESLFWWVVLDVKHPLYEVHRETRRPEDLQKLLSGTIIRGRDAYEKVFGEFIHYSAFTVAELGEMLHKRFNEWAQGWSDSGCFYHFQFGFRGAGSMIPGIGKTFGADTDKEADARAELLIHLLENP
jgi:hypothetical protein